MSDLLTVDAIRQQLADMTAERDRFDKRENEARWLLLDAKKANDALGEQLARQAELFAGQERIRESEIKVSKGVWETHQKQFDEQAEKIDAMTAERDKLAAFKAWVHSFLDVKGIPHHPPGTHGAEGCRIGDRMDYVFAKMGQLYEDLKCDDKAAIYDERDAAIKRAESAEAKLAELEEAIRITDDPMAVWEGEGKPAF